MLITTLDELIEGGLTETIAIPVSPNYYKKLFPKGFYPTTKVTIACALHEDLKTLNTTIVDHTEIKCGDIKSENHSYRNYNGNDLEKIRKQKGKMWKKYVFIIIPEKLHERVYWRECYFFPFYMINSNDLSRVNK